MSGITDPAEEYFKNGFWGWVTDQWKKLISDAAGHLQVDVVESGLPTGAATSANQTTMITALQLIDDLRAALTSVETDSLDVRLDGQTTDVEIKQTDAADLAVGMHGWDGSAWRKLPLAFGYYDRWAEEQAGAASGGGDAETATVAVPAGYAYIVQAVMANHNAGADRYLTVSIMAGALKATVLAVPTAMSGRWYSQFCQVVLKEGDTIAAKAATPGAGKVCKIHVRGYKMKIAE